MSTATLPKRRNPVLRWIAIFILAAAGLLAIWANGPGRRSFAPPSRLEQQVIDIADRTLDSFEVSATDDAVTFRYQDQGPVKPAPRTQTALTMNAILLGTICNLKRADIIGERTLYFDVSYGSDVILRLSVNAATLRGFDCDDAAWVMRTDLESAATLYQWSVD